jgi:hypothetical protein
MGSGVWCLAHGVVGGGGLSLTALWVAGSWLRGGGVGGGGGGCQEGPLLYFAALGRIIPSVKRLPCSALAY